MISQLKGMMTQNMYRKNAERFAKDLEEYRTQRAKKVKSVINLKMVDIFNLQRVEQYTPRPRFYSPTEVFGPYKDPRIKIYDRSELLTQDTSWRFHTTSSTSRTNRWTSSSPTNSKE